MKLSLLLLALALAATARAEIGLSDLDHVGPADAPQRHHPAAEAPARTPSPKPVTAVPAAPRSGPKDGIVRFRNGDILHGLLLGISGTNQFDWQYPDTKDTLHFSMQNVIQVTLPGGGPPPTGDATVTLSNGDLLRGDVVGLDDDSLSLNTPYAGLLKIKRTMVRCIAPRHANETIILDGLNTLDGWKASNGGETWRVHNGVLNVNQPGVIGRDLGLPDRCAVEFDMTWQPFPTFQVGLYVAQPEMIPGNGPGSGYWITLMANAAVFQRARPNDLTQLGQVEVRRFGRPGTGRIGIYVDKARKSFSLTLDGQLLRTWTEPEDFAGGGTSLIISASAGGNHTAQLSNLIVRQWNGELDDNTVVSGKTDILCLANNDRVSGQLKSIHQGKVLVASSVAPLEIPLDRINEMYFATENAERARRLAGDIVAVFHDGGRLTLALDEMDDKFLSGHSENFGQAKFDRAVFRELEFHIYDEDRGLPNDNDPALSTPANGGQIFNGNGNAIQMMNGGQIILRQGGRLIIGQ